MNTQMQKVTYYIETHLDETLDTKTLAKVAGYSHFHFCRIFKLRMGESSMSYATRLRLEKAASQVTLGTDSMINIALDAGFQTPSGFLKAFKKRFGTTPSEYKSNADALRNRYMEYKMKNVKIVQREKAYVVFTREKGDYETSSKIAWERLSQSMHNLSNVFAKKPPKRAMQLGEGNGEALGICHDDPEVTAEENLRYDAALVWDKEDVQELANYDFETKTVAGGKYAMAQYTGGSEEANKTWYGLYAWVEKNNYTFRDEPSFEKYLNAWNETDPSKILTEVYVPIV